MPLLEQVLDAEHRIAQHLRHEVNHDDWELIVFSYSGPSSDVRVTVYPQRTERTRTTQSDIANLDAIAEDLEILRAHKETTIDPRESWRIKLISVYPSKHRASPRSVLGV